MFKKMERNQRYFIASEIRDLNYQLFINNMIILDRFVKIFSHQIIRLSRKMEKGKLFFLAFLFNIVFLILFRWVSENYWPTFINSWKGNEWKLFAFFVPAISISNYLINHLIYYVIQKFDLFKNYKVTKDQSKLPWISDKQNWIKLRNRSLKLQFINMFLINIIFSFYDSFRTKINYTEEIPPIWQMLGHVYFCMIFESIFFFIVHWIGHQYLYSLHKVHHQFNVAHPLAANHFHPIDYIIGVIVPFGLGMRFLGNRMHFLSLILWTIWRGAEGLDGHSNYEFPWSPFRIIPFSGSSEYHSYHHTHNIGNFGSLFEFQDTLANQNVSYYNYVEQLKKQKKL